MRSWLRALLIVIVVAGIAIGGLLYVYWDQAVPIAALAINYVRYWSAPAGTLATEVAKTGGAARPSAGSTTSSLPSASDGTEGDWPSYNRTLTSNRFSPLSQINRTNADKLKVRCTYDTGQYASFTSGLLEVNGALIFVTEYDIFSIDPSTCHENWRTHEGYRPGCADFPLPVLHGRALLAEVQMTLSVTCRRRKTSRTSALVSILNSSATFSAMRWATTDSSSLAHLRRIKTIVRVVTGTCPQKAPRGLR